MNATEEKIKPAYFIEVWRGPKGNMIYQELTERGYAELQEWFDYKKMVNGQAATVYVFFSDYDIMDYEIIGAATAFMRGGWVTTKVDLNRCTSMHEIEPGKLNPRQ